MSEKIGFCQKVFRQLWYVEQLGFTVRSNTEFTSDQLSVLANWVSHSIQNGEQMEVRYHQFEELLS